MNYEIFKEVVVEKFMSYMPEEYSHLRVDMRPVEKVNITMDGLYLVSDEPMKVSPSLYVNNLYESYLATEDLHGVLTNAASTMAKALENAKDVVAELDYESAKDNIVFQIINTEQNKEMLKNVPNRPFQDLSIVYRWVVKIEDNGGIQSTMITNNLAKSLDMDEEKLFKLAAENTRRILPPTVRNMNDIMREMFTRDGMEPEMIEMMIEDVPSEKSMWIISNAIGINGAASMLYEDQLYSIAEKMETDLYIMPSSVHEVIAVSSEMGDPNELAAMVSDVNMNHVELNERLSNQVYHYDKDLRKLTLATDTPNKRLDGIVAEPKLIYETGKSR